MRYYCQIAICRILLLICSRSQPDDDPIGSKHVVVRILYKVVFDGYFPTPYSKKSAVCTARPLELQLLTGQPEFDFLK